MDTTIVLARISGIIFLLIGLSFMNKSYMEAIIDEMGNSKALFWFAGLVLAVLGSVMLGVYSTWSYHWPVLITILGWIALLKGMVIMLFPASWYAFYRKFKPSGIIMISGVAALISGIILLYQGFVR